MTIDVYGPLATVNVQAESNDFGNLRGVVGSATLAAVAQTKKVALCKVPPNCTLIGCHFYHAALGATTTLAIGTETMATGTAVPAAIRADTATTATATGYVTFAPIDSGNEGMYITATQGGAGTATGVVTVIPVFIWVGK
jgi:hypothetical protein